MFDDLDKIVIIELLSEKLPYVWMDALQEIDNGKTLETVVDEMQDGHILRILRKCGYDTQSWIEFFKFFYNRP